MPERDAAYAEGGIFHHEGSVLQGIVEIDGQTYTVTAVPLEGYIMQVSLTPMGADDARDLETCLTYASKAGSALDQKFGKGNFEAGDDNYGGKFAHYSYAFEDGNSILVAATWQWGKCDVEVHYSMGEPRTNQATF